jgi:penicillin amidase
MRMRLWTIAIGWVGLAAIGMGPCGNGGPMPLPGLSGDVEVTTDMDGVRHIVASDDFDLAVAQGYVHCRDRLFQMDGARRQADGTQSELLGSGSLGADIQARTIGLHRAAQRSFDASPARFQSLLQAYADGVNHCIATLPLPPEYAALELTSVRPWAAVDSMTIHKAYWASGALELDLGATLDLERYIAAGIVNGFDGQVLYSQDVVRAAPMDPASTVPDATGTSPFTAATVSAEPKRLASVAQSSEPVVERMREHPLFRLALERRERFVGSNAFGVGGRLTPGRRPILANDPHLSLSSPSVFWEGHLVVKDDPDEGPMNVSGVSLPGAPFVLLGQNEQITWGATTNPVDVSDIFEDELHVLLPECFLIGAFACIFSDGVFHPVEIEFETYSFNLIGDSIDDNLEVAPLPPALTLVATVPFRSFGPVLHITDPGVIGGGGISSALVLQYTGLHATGELQGVAALNRAADLSDFRDGLDHFDTGSQGWGYADAEGNLAYLTSGEWPLRDDLERGTVDGLPPFFVREGVSGDNNWVVDTVATGQAIPYEILPPAEMPQSVNPANDFFVAANNDPAGTTLDNDPLNQMRPASSSLYYLNGSYDVGLRAGRITRLIQAEAQSGKLSASALERIQANTQQLDAELLLPFVLEAFANASDTGAPTELATLAGDAGVTEAIGRLAAWDFSTPTGLDAGYDASDNNGNRAALFDEDGGGQAEIDASVAATIYNLWRAFAIRNVIDDRLAGVGLGAGGNDALKALHHLLAQEPYTGVATAGLDWIPEPAALDAEERRDLALLQALRDGLDQLASNDLADAFGNSTNQEDYRWGKLHRVVFRHPLGGPFEIPPQAGFEDLAVELPGVARDGGFGTVNDASFSARSIGIESFRFGSGSARRYVGRNLDKRISGVSSLPGGASGVPGDPNYANRLGTWLTADSGAVNMKTSVPGTTEAFVPPPAP